MTAWYCINYGKNSVKNTIEAIECHLSPPAMLGKGGTLELMGTASIRDGSTVAQSLLINMLHFKQRD